MAEFNISPDVSRAIEDSAQPTPKAPAMAGQIAAARDKISRLLNKQTAGYSDIQDHGTALLRAAAGTSTYGEALNAINAKKIQSLQSAYKLLAEERKFQADEDERRIRREATQALRSKPEFVNFVDPNDPTKVVSVNVNSSEGRGNIPAGYVRGGAVAAGRPKTAPRVSNVRWPDGTEEALDVNDPDVQERLRNGGGVVVSASAKKPSYKNIYFPDTKETQLVDMNDPRAVADAQRRGGKQVSVSAQGGTPGDIFAPGTTRGRNLQEQIASSEDALVDLNNAIEMLDTPGAKWGTGLRGWATDNIGGPVNQLLGTNKALVVFGPNEKVPQRVRTRLQGLLGRFIPTITGDTSGRYSDRDAQRAEIAARATDPKATIGQIRAAFEELREIESGASIRNRVRLSGVDLLSDEGVAMYAQEIKKMVPGLSTSDAVSRALRELRFAK